MADEPPGDFLGSYKILAPLGSGGMGDVFLAQDTKLRRKVALKLLPRELTLDEDARQGLLREAQTLASLEHPNICPIFDVDDVEGRTFIVMQYVAGETLAQRIQAQVLSVDDTVRISLQVLDALAEAHEHRVVHRDIKPQNIMVTPRGRVFVLDFGIAKALEQTATTRTGGIKGEPRTESGTFLGTVPYMSPEQATGGAIDGRSDIFSLGAVLFECLTGRMAFNGPTPIATLAQILDHHPPPPSTLNPAVSRALDRVTLKALAKSPTDRYESVQTMAADLRDALATGTPPTDASSIRARLSARLSRPLARPAYLTAVLALVLGSGAAVLSLRHPAPPVQNVAAQSWFAKGVESLRTGAAYQASRLLERAVQADAGYAVAHARLAEAYLELGNRVGAQDEILRVHNLLPNRSALPDADRISIEAVTALVSGDMTTAIARYQQLVKAAPQSPERHVELGYAYERANQSDSAIEAYQQAIALDGDYAAAYLRLGILYGRQQQRGPAEQAFANAERAFRDLGSVEGRAEVHYSRGFLLRNYNDLARSKEELQQAYNLAGAAGNEPTQVLALLQLSSIAFAEGTPEKAEELAGSAVTLAQQKGWPTVSVRALIDLGNSLVVRNDLTRAEKYYQEALASALTYKDAAGEARARFMLGNVFITRGEYQRGLEHVERAQAFFHRGNYRTETLQAMTLLGRAKRDLGDLAGAAAAFAEVLTLSEHGNDRSQMATARDEIGRVLYMQERFPEALQQLRDNCPEYEALALPLDAAYCYANLGSVHWQLGDYTAAAADYKASRTLAPDAKAYKGLIATLNQSATEMELSRGASKADFDKVRRLLQPVSEPDSELQVDLLRLPGLAAVRAGNVVDGLRLCRAAVDKATTLGNPWLIGKARLAHAEALLAHREFEAAAEGATSLAARLAASGQRESAWRASALAALAFAEAGDRRRADESVTRAQGTMTEMEHAWGDDAFRSYSTRPDVTRLRERLTAVRSR